MFVMRSLMTLLAIAVVAGEDSVPLDEYVYRPDPHYSYHFKTTFKGPGTTTHVLEMTSQKWMDDTITPNPVWTHQLLVILPDNVSYNDTAFMFIGGGNNGDPDPTLADGDVKRMARIAQHTGSVTAVIRQIPNEPIVFQNDPNHVTRTEDAIIAYTWRKFLNNESNSDILLRMPMTKAAVRGMDTIAQYVKDHTGNIIDKFVVAGMSKRGWTTWTTAAVDRRVIGMAPTVFDLLNVQKNVHHHYRSLGGYTFALRDYYAQNITKEFDNAGMVELLKVEDPIAYLDRYTMPKIIITAGSDEFFLPDDSHYFFDQLKNVKYMRVIPNSGHSVSIQEAMYDRTLEGFYFNILEKAQFPNVTWVLNQTSSGGRITARTSRVPKTVTVYYATTTDGVRRDFRQHILDRTTGTATVNPVFWFYDNATQTSALDYQADMTNPATGWLAFFIEFTFDGAKNSTLEITTEINIIPDTFPFPDCSGEACYGTLV